MLIVDARTGGQQDIPDLYHAMSHYRLAVARGDDTIRVDKPGHTADFRVSELRTFLNRDPRWAPRCIIDLPMIERERLGSTHETLTRNWLGAAL